MGGGPGGDVGDAKDGAASHERKGKTIRSSTMPIYENKQYKHDSYYTTTT
jgi:hypothetical protein